MAGRNGFCPEQPALREGVAETGVLRLQRGVYPDVDGQAGDGDQAKGEREWAV